MPVKILEKRFSMLDDVAASAKTGNQFSAYVNIYNGVPGIGCCPPWELCVVSKDVNRGIYYTDVVGEMMELPVHHIASDMLIAFELPPKARVIASRKQQFFPQFYDDEEQAPALIYKGFDESSFFAGVISEEYRHGDNGVEYLVFFDDCHAQYVDSRDIRVVNGNPGIEHVPENTRIFYDYYFGARWTHRRRADCKINETIRVLLNGSFRNAKVCRFYGLLISIHFLDENIFEWIYEGSDRIEVVHKSICNFLKSSGIGRIQSNAKVSINEELFYSEAYKNKLKREQQLGLGLNAHKLDHSIISDNDDDGDDDDSSSSSSTSSDTSTKSTKSSDAGQVAYNDAKMAIEFLIILTQIRHEMNRAGKRRQRLTLFAAKPIIGRESYWKRICRFLRIDVSQQNRNGLKVMIHHFMEVDEFRTTYEHYIKARAVQRKSTDKRPTFAERNATEIQQEVMEKIQLMQKYLEDRASGGQNDAFSNVNMVQYLDEIINDFTKLTANY